jgi:hypothetical protein
LREQHLHRAWLCRLSVFIAAVCACFLPHLLACAQQLPAEPVPRARFGQVTAVDDKKTPVDDKKIEIVQPDKDAKKKKPGDKDSGVLLYAMPLTPPGPELLFRLDSEEVFQERLRNEVRKKAPKLKLEFPEADPPALKPVVRDWPDGVLWVEPNYGFSRRLFFEQSRFERYGDSLGILQPAVSSGIFGMDLVLWPARRLAQPFRCYQVNTDCYSPYFQLVD